MLGKAVNINYKMATQLIISDAASTNLRRKLQDPMELQQQQQQPSMEESGEFAVAPDGSALFTPTVVASFAMKPSDNKGSSSLIQQDKLTSV